MAGRLAGKTAIISGGATGAGGAASKLFAAEGARVAIFDINVAAGEAVVAEILQAGGGEAAFFKADVSDRAQIEHALAGANARFGPVSVLFNHAGTIVVKPFLDTTDEDFDRLMDINVKSMFMVTRAVAVEYRDRGIRCNAVCPGFIDTLHGQREIAALTQHGVDASVAALSLQQGRLCQPEEVAKAALFLASDEASFVNGAHLFVDNCFTAA